MRRKTQEAIATAVSQALAVQSERHHTLETIERRFSPPASTAATRWKYFGPEGSMPADWDAGIAVREQYIANTYVYRCAQVIARAISGCAFRAGRDGTKRGDFNINANLAKFLGPAPGSPNPNLSPRRLWAWTTVQYLITGRWAWEVEGKGNNVIGLWPIPSKLIDPIPSTSGRDYFSGYLFAKDDPSRRRTLQLDELLYDWQPSQDDVRQAESVLQAAKLDVNVAVMQDRYEYAFLKNDARPAQMLVHEEFQEDQERSLFRQQFLADHRGVDNAGKTVFVEATPSDTQDLAKTFHIEQLGLSQKDAEFIPRMEAKIRAICIAFGTPLSILGDSSARTFDNAGREYTNWWEGTILPIMADFEDAINMKLAPRLGREIGWFDVSNVAALQDSSKIIALGSSAAPFVEKGIFTINEVRAEYDLDEIEEPEEEPEEEPPAEEPAPEKPEVDHDTQADAQEQQNQPQGRMAPTASLKLVSDEGDIVVLRRVL